MNIPPRVPLFIGFGATTCGAAVAIASATGKLKDVGWLMWPLFTVAAVFFILAAISIFKRDDNAIFESDVQTMMRRMRKHYDNASYRGNSFFPNIQPSPGDNLDVFNEALLRVKREREPNPNARQRD